LLFWSPFYSYQSSLLVRHAHDLGGPGAILVITFLVLMAIMLALIARASNGDSGLAEAVWLRSATGTAVLIAAFLLGGFLYFWLAFKKGQPKANRYRAVPR
jgi:uncharacterized membrane protein YhaH (DUF805 family)